MIISPGFSASWPKKLSRSIDDVGGKHQVRGKVCQGDLIAVGVNDLAVAIAVVRDRVIECQRARFQELENRVVDDIPADTRRPAPAKTQDTAGIDRRAARIGPRRAVNNHNRGPGNLVDPIITASFPHGPSQIVESKSSLRPLARVNVDVPEPVALLVIVPP